MDFANFVGGSYTAESVNVAAEECIGLYAELNETAGAQAKYSYIWSPGLKTFTTLSGSPVCSLQWAEGRCFSVTDSKLFEIFADGTHSILQTISTDGNIVSMASSNTQLLIVAASRAYCYDFTSNTLTEVTGLLAAVPLQVQYSDGYFIVIFQNSNKFQVSGLFDGTSWPGLQVNEVSVFPENISSIIVSQRQLSVFGSRHIQVYSNTGSDNIFDPIPGAFIENGCGATFCPCRLDNTVFWVNEDERGGRMAFRANGYTPLRVSTHAVEVALNSYPSIANLVTYAYQDNGHTFWVLYIPGTDCSWTYDASTQLWAKRATWNTDTATYTPHHSWNHVYIFGKHLVGDWASGKVYEMNQNFYDEDGGMIRRVRQAPTINSELQRLFYSEVRIDFDTGLGPQPPLVDGNGDPRPPQAMLQWSNDGGHTWGNEHWRDCGFAGEYGTFVRWQRLGYARRRVFRLIMTDAIPWSVVNASLEVEAESK